MSRHVEDDPDDDLNDSSEDCNDDDDIFSIHSDLRTLCTVYPSTLYAYILYPCISPTIQQGKLIPQTEIFTNFTPNVFEQPKLPRGNLKKSLKILPCQ